MTQSLIVGPFATFQVQARKPENVSTRKKIRKPIDIKSRGERRRHQRHRSIALSERRRVEERWRRYLAARESLNHVTKFVSSRDRAGDHERLMCARDFQAKSRSLEYDIRAFERCSCPIERRTHARTAQSLHLWKENQQASCAIHAAPIPCTARNASSKYRPIR
jgi:hypothetical protein